MGQKWTSALSLNLPSWEGREGERGGHVSSPSTLLQETASHPNYSISQLFFLSKCILCLKLKHKNNKINSLVCQAARERQDTILYIEGLPKENRNSGPRCLVEWIKN